MKKTWTRVTIVSLVCLASALYFFIDRASFRVARLFQHHAILQREKAVPVWGWGKPGRDVHVFLEKTGDSTFETESFRTTIPADGSWIVKLKPHEAGGPYRLIVEGHWKKITINNVYFGDVWLCTGQSNMAMRVREADHAATAIAGADNPSIRHFKIPKKGSPGLARDFEKGKWETCSPETVGEFSAVGYYFAKALQEDRDLPIGLLNASTGSSRIESWIPAGCFGYGSPVEAEKAIAAMLESEKLEHTRNMPTCLYNSMIFPARQFPVKGILWWQGESNAHQDEAYNYRNMFPCLISSWREAWGDSLLPFLYVQLANVAMSPEGQDDHLDWPMLRESQSVVLQQFAQVAQIVSFDISDPTDIHPGNKQDIGKRLALAAQRLAYGEDVVYSGPVFQSMENLGAKLRLRFAPRGSGLATKTAEDVLKGFTIAGPDRIFHPANAVIEGNEIIVWSEKVSGPVAARYAWKRSPVDANLCNAEGLPAPPFRTDDW